MVAFATGIVALTVVCSVWFPPAADRLAARGRLPPPPTMGSLRSGIVTHRWRVAVSVGVSTLLASRLRWWPPLVVLCFVVFGAGWLVAMVDLRVRRLPDAVAAPTWIVTCVIVVAGAWWLDEPWRVRGALAAAGAAGFTLGVGWLIGMGMGDLKWGALLAVPVGWAAPGASSSIHAGLALVGLASALAVAVVVITQVLHHRPRAPIAFGPFLLAAAVVVLIVVAGRPLGTSVGQTGALWSGP